MILASWLLLLTLGLSQEERTADISFPTTELIAWKDQSQMIAFKVGQPVSGDQSWRASTSAPEVLKIVRQPQILDGRTDGYLRVQGIREGEARLNLGNSTLNVTVRALPSRSRFRNIQATIVAPVANSYVWGTSLVAVEVHAAELERRYPDLEVRLHTSDGDVLEAVDSNRPKGIPTHSYYFKLDAEQYPEGTLGMYAEVIHKGVPVASSVSTAIQLAHPSADEITSVECEHYVSKWYNRSKGYADLRLGSDDSASGRGFVICRNANPTWKLPQTIEESGWYQIMIRTRGDWGAGTYPSLALRKGDPMQSIGAARTVHHKWHRIPLGGPIELETGDHELFFPFVNTPPAQSVRRRILYLDRVEIIKVDDLAPPAAEIPALAEAGSSMSNSMNMGSGQMRASMEGAAKRQATNYFDGLWIAFSKPLDGLPVNGRLDIQGFCNWANAGTSSAPMVELWLNGEPVMDQQAARPLFLLDPSAFAPGANTVQLKAHLPDGRTAETTEQVVSADPPANYGPPQPTHRFSVLSELWDPSIQDTLDQQGQENGHRVAKLRDRDSLSLNLPPDLCGDYEVFLEGVGPFNGQAAEVSVRLSRNQDEEETEIKTSLIHWWQRKRVGTLELHGGDQRLTLEVSRVLNQGEQDRPLQLRSIFLRKTTQEKDILPPQVKILYPAPDHVAWKVDAVIAKALDNNRLQSADVLLDGLPQGSYAYIPDGAGYLHLPLLLRNIEPGQHKIAVRVWDRAGNMTQSPDQIIQVAAQRPQKLGPYQRAIHLLNRLAFGPSPQDLAALLIQGEDAWLNQQLHEAGSGDQAAIEYAVAMRGENFYYDINRALMAQLLRTPNPVRARFCAWAENHFSTWVNKTGAPSEWWEHLVYSGLGPTSFQELLLTSATSPAMLNYLDQRYSFAGRLNENFARELMELHTLGVDGGYTQAEVTDLAHLLTGLTVTEEASLDGRNAYLLGSFRIAADLSSSKERAILGYRFDSPQESGACDRFLQVIELLASHPQTAKHVCRKLAEHYVAAPAPEDLIEALSHEYLTTGGDMREVLKALTKHPSFWDQTARICTPFDFALRFGRTTGNLAVDWALRSFLGKSGMGYFDRATPDGYPYEDEEWTDSRITLQRWQFVQQTAWATHHLILDPIRSREAGDLEEWSQRFVDQIAVRLTGKTLSPESNQVALDFLREDQDQTWQRMNQTATFICSLPEASLK